MVADPRKAFLAIFDVFACMVRRVGAGMFFLPRSSSSLPFAYSRRSIGTGQRWRPVACAESLPKGNNWLEYNLNPTPGWLNRQKEATDDSLAKSQLISYLGQLWAFEPQMDQKC